MSVIVTPGVKQIVVKFAGESPGVVFTIQVSDGPTSFPETSYSIPAGGNGKVVLSPLLPGTYAVTITGTGRETLNFPDEQVT
jgi:hypothetical protein